MSFYRWFYSGLLYIATPLIWGWLWLKGRNNPDYRRRWQERVARRWETGQAPMKTGGLLVHCASVGEFLAAKPLIERVLDSQPDRNLLITCTTPTASALITKALGSRVQHCYLPIDTPAAITRFLERFRPTGIVLMETEVWPNLILQAHKRGVPVGLINGRLSERSLKGYLRFDKLMRPVWSSLTLCAVQNDTIAERFRELGVTDQALDVSGNLKFDVIISPAVRAETEQLKSLIGHREIMVAASTHEGEEQIILDAWSRICRTRPQALLILVPRHKERFREVASLVEKHNFDFVTRSSGRPVLESTQVLLGDTMGELMIWFGIARIAFVGGSLIERGGHNPLEPMAYGLPVLSGRNVFNFEQVYKQLDARQAVRWVQDTDSLHDTVLGLLQNTETAQTIGAQAQQIFGRHRGATARTQMLIEQMLHRKPGGLNG